MNFCSPLSNFPTLLSVFDKTMKYDVYEDKEIGQRLKKDIKMISGTE